MKNNKTLDGQHYSSPVAVIPRWDNNPFKNLLPSAFELRKEGNLISLGVKKHKCHIDLDNVQKFDAAFYNKVLLPAMQSLIESVMEIEFPGQLQQFVKMQKRLNELGWAKLVRLSD